MQKLLRKNILTPTFSTIRGGHGWDAPPPPLPTMYDHKRIISIFDSGMWWGCGTMPEYLISYFEMHLKDQYGAAAEIMRIGAHSAAFAIGLGLFMLLCYNEADYELDNTTVENFVKGTMKEITDRPLAKRNLFGFSTSHDDGKIYVNYDTPGCSHRILKRNLIPAEERKQINLEAKNCMVKLELEIRKKYQ